MKYDSYTALQYTCTARESPQYARQKHTAASSGHEETDEDDDALSFSAARASPTAISKAVSIQQLFSSNSVQFSMHTTKVSGNSCTWSLQYYKVKRS